MNNERSEIYKVGKLAYEAGKSFLDDNPYLCGDDKHYFWAEGWFERKRHYENIAHEKSLKEMEEETQRDFIEYEKRQSEIKHKNSKKGKQEKAGQKTLFP